MPQTPVAVVTVHTGVKNNNFFSMILLFFQMNLSLENKFLIQKD